jgi:multidrug efflux pump subunit AcrB
MKGIINFFIKRPLVVNLLTIIIIIMGLVSAINLKRETFPNINFDLIIITTNYPGSSSEDVEKLVTISIERQLKGIDGIKNLNGLSAEGKSIVYLEIDPETDLKVVLDDVTGAIDNIDNFPENVKRPKIRSVGNTTRGIVKVALYGASYEKLRKASKKLRDNLEGYSEISKVNLGGYYPDEIRVEVNPNKMIRYQLTFSEVSNSIKDRNLNLSAGKIIGKDGDIMIRTLSEFTSVEDIKNIVIKSNSSGRRVRIKDIAKVLRQPESEGIILQRSQGERAIFLDVLVKNSADVIISANKIKQEVEAFFKKNPFFGDIKFRYTDDFSYYVKRRLGVLGSSGRQGMFLVFLCLLLFLNLSTSVMTSLGAPLAFLISFIVMDYTGLSLNLISMFGLILVLGMLVDDAIIVSEHYYQKLEKGMNPREAAREAAIETIRPVTATVLTTIIAFGSLLYMGGIMGKFLRPVPIVVIVCLLASLFECFCILPSHLADFSRLKKNKKGRERWYQPFLNIYKNILSRLLKAPTFFVFFFIIACFGGAFLSLKTMNFELFPGDDVRTVMVQIKGKVGIPIRKTDEAVEKLEGLIFKRLKKEELDQIRAKVGQFRGDFGNKTGSHYGSVIVYLTSPDERSRSTDQILNDLTEEAKSLVPNFIISVKKVQGGPPKGKALEVELLGDSIEELKVVSQKVFEIVRGVEGVLSCEIDFEEGKNQVIVKVNDRESKRLGISTTQVALELRKAFAGDIVTEIRESDEDIAVRVLLDKKSRSRVQSLSKLYILNNKGQRIALKRVTTLEKRPGAFVIRRQNRRRIFSVSGSLDKSKTNPFKIKEILTPQISKVLKDYPNVTYRFGGENKDTIESMDRLKKSFLISMLIIFFVLIAMFNSVGQPFVIMAAIPLGLTGVIFTFKLFGDPLGFMAGMGVIGLVGVVVNDSIVLVNFINKKREDIESLGQAILEASVSRFRPVILTTLTTVAGLFPIAHAGLFGGPAGDPFLKPMALSFAYGLLFSTMITLLFIPCLYLFYEKYKKILAAFLAFFLAAGIIFYLIKS